MTGLACELFFLTCAAYQETLFPISSISPNVQPNKMARIEDGAEPHEVYPTILVLDFGYV